MNKNFFRAFKREFKNNFDTFVQSTQNDSKSSQRVFAKRVKDINIQNIENTDIKAFKRQSKFRLKLEEYSQYLLREFGEEFIDEPFSTSSKNAPENVFSQSDFTTYLGIFLNYCLMKKMVCTPKDKIKLENTNFIAYSYSHQKFYEFMKIPEVYALLKILFKMITVEEFVKNHPALKTHETNYVNHVKRLLVTIGK